MDYIEREMLMEELINENSRLKKLRRARATLMDGDASEEDKLKANAKIQMNKNGMRISARNRTKERRPEDLEKEEIDALKRYGREMKEDPLNAEKTQLRDLDFKQVAKNNKIDKEIWDRNPSRR